MNICETYEALLDLYVDGELTAEEMLQVQEHLDTCPACRGYVDDAFALRAAFPDEESAPLPENFHASVMEKITQSAAPAPKRRTWMGLPALAAACLALVVAVGGGKSAAPEAVRYSHAAAAPAASAPAASAPAEAAQEAPAAAEPAAPAPSYAVTAAETECTKDRQTLSDTAGDDGETAPYFATLTLTAQEAGDLLEGFEAMEWAEGAAAYALTAEEYEDLLAAVDRAADLNRTEGDGLALVIIQEP